ncbi:thioredoxin family protein [Verrucomicrobiales bacterium]|jgi:peroxiredoxin|nr:thioredoxin family protein [Verrucomicrobiales bacterium]|tara:strand:- start:65 stop:646 length:582 start_codon:yes stop_codon:yes gene_type:complete
MAEVPSTFQLKPGDSAPDFELPDGNGEIHQLANLLAGKKGLMIAFACNHCPFVVHLAEALGSFGDEVASKGIQTVVINSNDVANYPADSPERMLEFADSSGWHFPYLYDESQNVAKSYAAACTPDFYLFDSCLKLVYAGQFDDSRPGRGTADGASLRAAVDQLLAERSVPEPWYPSSGCSIKWKPGEAPDYFG